METNVGNIRLYVCEQYVLVTVSYESETHTNNLCAVYFLIPVAVEAVRYPPKTLACRR